MSPFQAGRLSGVFLACLLVLSSSPAAGEASAPETGKAPPVPSRATELKLALMGGGALGAGTPLWAGGELGLEHRLGRKGLVGGRFKLTFGNDDEGRPLGGYRVNGVVGFDWFDSRYVSWKWLLHGGLLSVAWVPTPNVGLDSELSFSPLSFTHFRWSLGWDLTGEFPWRVSTSVWSEVAIPFETFSVGVKATAGAHVGVDLVGVGAGLVLQLAWRF